MATDYGNWSMGPGGAGMCPCCGFQAGMMGSPMAWGQTWGGPYYGGMPGMGAPMGPMMGWMQPPMAGPWAGPMAMPRAPMAAPDDDAIREMIYDSIDADPAVPYESDVTVDVTAGVVTLSGTVPNKRIKHAVGDDAWWVPGVMDVNNQLAISGRRERGQTPPQRRQATGEQKPR